jgi:DNA-binding IclR family transcriptional regulator
MLLTIDSAGRVLDLFTPSVHERGVTEVALELGVSKSKAHALLASLAHVGLLRRTPTGRYRLGWRVLKLNRILDESTDFRAAARPILRVLRDRFGETIHVGTLDHGRVVVVDRVVGPNTSANDDSAVGAALPAHCTALGKVLLASLEKSELFDIVVSERLALRTPHTTTDPGALLDQLEQVHLHRMAIDREENTLGVCSVAAPIVAPGPHTVAAISLSAPTQRFAENESIYRRAVGLAAQHVSRSLREGGMHRAISPARIPDTAAA